MLAWAGHINSRKSRKGIYPLVKKFSCPVEKFFTVLEFLLFICNALAGIPDIETIYGDGKGRRGKEKEGYS